MKATIKFATERFREFNRQMFEGRLPEVPILMSDAGRALGMLKYERKRDLSGNVTCGNFRILISTRYDLPQEQIEDTIIHEIIMCAWNLGLLVALIAVSISSFSEDISKGFAVMLLFLPFIAADVLFLRFALYSNYKKLKIRILDILV